MNMEATKIIYHIDDEDTPYLIKLPIAADKVTLGDFKNALNRPNYKFFFKSMDDDFGVVKEELVDEAAHLPVFNGRVVSWLVAAESSETGSQCGSQTGADAPPAERVGGIGDSRPPSFHANASTRGDQDCDTYTETESMASNRRAQNILNCLLALFHKKANSHHLLAEHRGQPPHHRQSSNSHQHPHPRDSRHHKVPRVNGHSKQRPPHAHGYDATSSVMSSDLDTTSFFDSDEDSRFSTATDTTTRSSKYGRHRRRRRKHRIPPISRASSFSSITDSTMSLNIITVTLNLDTVNFLGISIVGQSNKGGDGGIYVGSIMKGGAVAQDGRIEPGDMILEVNGMSFENMSNDDAVKALRESVQKPGPITLVVAKCWDPSPKGYFSVPHQEPVRPIDPSAWVAHTEAVRSGAAGGVTVGYVGDNRVPPQLQPMLPVPGSVTTMSSTSSSITSSMPDSESMLGDLTISSDMKGVVKAMALPDSGLEIRDRNWLKITIPNAFIGSDLVDWLFQRVGGFADRRDARKYATTLLKAGFIRHTVNKLTFSEQCYYVFGDLCGASQPLDYGSHSDMLSSASNLTPHIQNNMSSLTLEDIDSVSEAGGGPPMMPEHHRDPPMLGAPGGPPLPRPPHPPPMWANTYSSNPYGASYLPPPPPNMGHQSMNYAQTAAPYLNDSASYISMPGNGAESVHSGSAKRDQSCACIVGHLNKQIRKLWENPDKQNHLHNGVKPPKFDADIDQSTSSESGSSTSSHSQRNGRGGSRGSRPSGSDTETGSIRTKPLPPPKPQLPGGGATTAADGDETITMMGDI